MKLDFFKMQAQGNDYIYFDFRSKPIPKMDFDRLSIKLSNRRYNIGSDGIVLIEPSEVAKAKMRIFNSDGSEGKMCGSALQCVIYYLSLNSNHANFKIETAFGIKTGKVLPKSKNVKVCLGKPTLVEKVTIRGFNGNLIDIGNPHFVTFVDDLNEVNTTKTGSKIESDHQFPDGVNVEFVEIISKNEVKMKVWERGSGVTLSCGTGSCASVYAGISNELLDRSVKLHSPGGNVIIDFDGSDIFLTGEVEFVFYGEVEV
jgi:diaminopimelate epimerase